MDKLEIIKMVKFIKNNIIAVEKRMEPDKQELAQLMKMLTSVQNMCKHPNEFRTGAHGHNDSEYHCPDCSRTTWG